MKSNILRTKEFLMQSQANDLVVLVFAGHGLLSDELDYYFATADMDFADPSRQGLPYTAIESLVDGIPARKKLVLLDTCHAGEVDRVGTELAQSNDQGSIGVVTQSFRHLVPSGRQDRAGPGDSFALLRELFANLRRGTGAFVIAAAGGYEFAVESEQWENGVFTYSLLQGLRSRSADQDQDGRILVSALRDYVIEQVQRLTHGQQRPVAQQENLEVDFGIG
jgi:uncharacterized caspase-like protein